MRWGVFVAGMLAVLFSGGQAEAQDNAACDAACDVPCYFGECAPARASYTAALERCDVGRLELVGRLYQGTVSGDKARDAAALLRAQGYATSRIGVTPNSSGGAVQDCTALVEGGAVNTPGNPCALVNVPSGWRCEVVGGRAELIQQAPASTVATIPAPAPSTGLGPRPASGQAATHYDQCVAGNADSCDSLGFRYDKGTDGVSQNDTLAVAAYRRACDGGSASGCTNLGIMYERDRGVPRDYLQAVALYRKGCDNGNARGCTGLGALYGTGRGVAKDFVRAVALYRQGCDGGNSNGCSGLGNYYRLGWGVTKDLDQARIFLTQGCDAGDQWGCGKLKELP